MAVSSSLAHDIVARARALFAAQLRNDAERAAAVTALGELDVGARARVEISRGSSC